MAQAVQQVYAGQAMNRFASLITFFTLFLTCLLFAQTAPSPAQSTKRKPFQPAAQAQPGGGPDKVWVNTNSSVYHCFGDRYYGRTANGRYMTEASARSAGAKGPRGHTCSVSK